MARESSLHWTKRPGSSRFCLCNHLGSSQKHSARILRAKPWESSEVRTHPTECFTLWNLQKCFSFTLNMCNKALKADVIVWWGSWLQSRGCLSTQDHQSFDQTPTGALRTFLVLRLLSNILLSCSEEPPGEKQDIFWCLRPYKTVDTAAFTTLCVFLIRFSVIYLKMLLSGLNLCFSFVCFFCFPSLDAPVSSLITHFFSSSCCFPNKI